MNIYPAIDIKSGECVRLYQGNYDQVSVYENDPVAIAQSFAKQGSTFLHMVDLDGAKQGKSINLDLIVKIAKETHLKIQTGGGIRTKKQIKKLLNNGIDKIVLGSIAITQSHLVQDWLEEFGQDRIVIALDVRIDSMRLPRVALHGWQTASEITLWQLLDKYANSSLRHVLCTDISRDGTLNGPNVALYQECVERYPSLQFQASGGVSTLQDLDLLAKIPVPSVIVGKAFYEHRFTLKEAFASGGAVDTKISEASTC